jgi:tripartite-type tricarboxylate transporter receptor subunit TctC
MKLSKIIAFAAAVSILGVAEEARAWPDRPIELLVGFAPGGGTDVTARTLAPFLERELGGRVLVVNRPGASGEIALAAIVNAPADGHTIGMTNMPGLVTLPIERAARFKLDDFAFIGNVASDPSAFSVLASSPYKSLKDVMTHARQHPGDITFGTTGVGTDDHLAMVLFGQATGIAFTHVPFSGAGPLRTALLGQHVVAAGLNVGEAVPYKDRLRIIVQGGETRSPFLPDVPTFKEAGIDVVIGSERGIVAPKGIPAAVETRLGEALAKAVADPEFKRKVEEQFTELAYEPGAAWRDRLKQLDASYRALWKTNPWNR